MNSVVSDIFSFFPAYFILGLEGEAGVLSSPWKLGASDEFSMLFQGEQLSTYSEKFIPILFPRATMAVSDVTL